MTLKQAIDRYTDTVEFTYECCNWQVLSFEDANSYVLAQDTETGGLMYIHAQQDVSVVQWDEITGLEYTVN